MATSEIEQNNSTAPIYVLTFDKEGRHIQMLSEAHTKPFVDFIKELPNKLDREECIHRVVVIRGEDILPYSAETFWWLAGIAPNPFNNDPNWMGSKK